MCVYCFADSPAVWQNVQSRSTSTAVCLEEKSRPRHRKQAPLALYCNVLPCAELHLHTTLYTRQKRNFFRLNHYVWKLIPAKKWRKKSEVRNDQLKLRADKLKIPWIQNTKTSHLQSRSDFTSCKNNQGKVFIRLSKFQVFSSMTRKIEHKMKVRTMTYCTISF